MANGQPSRESTRIAERLVEGLTIPPEVVGELVRRIAVAMDISWYQGHEDAEMARRLFATRMAAGR